ncbi:aminotransferase class I/II-fold pyridoxal phosphate-dependent enzyme [Kineosporia sp. NBRC 101731]|uniref:aminotransferase class I/II-fold pyridoxal phosphate-dependent enzyme n=1 Tax=Kineosporia sp. NBRC 101731 TaxID=3032199 RepID=UPI0024A4D8B3|nr:aminotransferase class I/II-fold pyridoxal phosphate-dependent enzyme [Kineosporia sp. NBRC 101731]GLY30186.1 aminotransferase [Kineosporia sp. NBRC 101731]
MVDGTWRRVAKAAGLLDRNGVPTPTIFARMSELASRTGAINLGQGFPDTDGPAVVLESAVDAIRSGANQYPPGRGVLPLRQAIARHQSHWYGMEPDPDTEILVTAGATEALTASIIALTEPGDEVVVLEPIYDSYSAAIEMAGAVRRTVRLEWPEYRLTAEALNAAVSGRTRLILLNTPHNPTGRVLDRAELDLVATVARERDLIVVADEVYEHLTFAPHRHTPIATRPGMAERTVTISSAGKTFSVTGWKIGWLHAQRDIVDAITAVKQFLTYVNGGPFQPAVALGLALPDDEIRSIGEDLGRRSTLLTEGLAAAGFGVRPSDGTYFVIADAAPLGYTDGAALCDDLPRLAGVVGVPVQAFSEDPSVPSSLVRFACCKRPEVIAEAAGRLAGMRT